MTLMIAQQLHPRNSSSTGVSLCVCEEGLALSLRGTFLSFRVCVCGSPALCRTHWMMIVLREKEDRCEGNRSSLLTAHTAVDGSPPALTVSELTVSDRDIQALGFNGKSDERKSRQRWWC